MKNKKNLGMTGGKNLGEIFTQGTRFHVPIWQRPYVWGRKSSGSHFGST